MLKNQFKIELRTMRREKGYAFIHIAGLAVGMAACLLIGLYVQDELSYDAFHANADRTYRVLREFDIPDLHSTISTTPPALAPALEESVPAIEAAVRIRRTSPVVQQGPHKAIESDFLWADAGFFEVFSFLMLQGEAALERPATVILTAERATTYFPNEDPIGKTLQVDDQDVTVTGVMADLPANSHLQAGFVGSLSTAPPSLNWGFNNYVTYVLLAEGASKEAVTRQVAETIEANTNPTGDERAGHAFIPHLQPITGIHLGQGVDVDIGSQGKRQYVYLFVVLAGFIILLACINFMNLATARSAGRAREIGIRKTLGARREQLGAQFLGESLLMSMIALVLALLIVDLGLPALNQLVGKSLTARALYEGPQVLALLGLGVFVGLLAGTYPALVLSHFRPAQVLKGTMTGPRGNRLRKGLVVFQFAISIALIAGTGISQSQLRFMRSAGLGFDAEDRVLIKQAGYLGEGIDAFEQELKKLPGVQRVASGFSMPGTFFINSMWQPSTPGSEAHNMDYSFVGFDYVETLGIEIVAGRSLSRAFPTDSFAVMLSETAVKDFGWSVEEALGQTLSPSWGSIEFTVVGVTKDFHYRSLHAEIYPLALFGPLRTPRYVAVRVSPDKVANTLEAIRSLWKQFSDLPLEYAFLADDLVATYRTEERLTKIFGIFSGLAILIACLGLFGLAAFTAEQRTKEIGIRKVLGASVANLVALLSKDFLRLVLIAFVVAVPVAYLAMERWLEDFAYRIDLGVGTFALAGGLALGIALLTVSYQALKAALADPVRALRYE